MLGSQSPLSFEIDDLAPPTDGLHPCTPSLGQITHVVNAANSGGRETFASTGVKYHYVDVEDQEVSLSCSQPVWPPRLEALLMDVPTEWDPPLKPFHPD